MLDKVDGLCAQRDQLKKALAGLWQGQSAGRRPMVSLTTYRSIAISTRVLTVYRLDVRIDLWKID
jgi:hypothetical protein